MKNVKFWLAAIVVTSFVSINSVAQTATAKKCEQGEHYQRLNDIDSRDGVGPMPHRHMQKDRLPPEAGLDLTDAQKKTLADARTAQEPTLRDLHEKMRTAHEALDKAGDANVDDTTLTTLSNNLAVLIAQQEVARIKMHKQLLSVLTPEQKQKLETFKAEHKNAPRWKEKSKEMH